MAAPRSYSTLELQAAAQALITGVFAGGDDLPPDGLVPLAAGSVLDAAPDLGTLVRVVAASAGAGASTLAVAIADAAGSPVRLLDAASAPWSGLLPVTSTELGGRGGWRHGKRGQRVAVERLDFDVPHVGAVPLPRPTSDETWTVLDVGWSQRELTAAPGHWTTSAPALAEVVAGRLTEHGLHQVEWTLQRLGLAHTVVALTGAAKVRSSDLLAAGPALRELHADGRVVGVPFLSRRVFPGLGPGELPKPLRTAGELVWSLVTAMRPASTTATSPVLSPLASPTL